MIKVVVLALLLLTSIGHAEQCPSATYQTQGDEYIRLTDHATIPKNLNNRDYVCEQAWEAAGNTPVAVTAAPNPTVISSLAFFGRFTQGEQAAIWQSSVANGSLGAALTHGLASGSIDLTDAVVKAWMDALVSAGAITAQRETQILTP